MVNRYNKIEKLIDFLTRKATWVRKETLNIHKIAQETRLASSLSCVEIFVTLFYGDIVKHRPYNPEWEDRDRFIISKGHGGISFYPILADKGYFDKKMLSKVCIEGSFLGGIPDCIIPGFETTNGSLGHGLGVACGISLGLKLKKKSNNVFVLIGDGELYEGAIWEAVMFAGEHRLNNIVMIIDNNRVSMLDYCKNIINLEPLEEKFMAFRWHVETVDGHDVGELYKVLKKLKTTKKGGKPKVLIANTIKGKGIAQLENDPLSHIRNLNPKEIDKLTAELK